VTEQVMEADLPDGKRYLRMASAQT